MFFESVFFASRNSISTKQYYFFFIELKKNDETIIKLEKEKAQKESIIKNLKSNESSYLHQLNQKESEIEKLQKQISELQENQIQYGVNNIFLHLPPIFTLVDLAPLGDARWKWPLTQEVCHWLSYFLGQFLGHFFCSIIMIGPIFFQLLLFSKGFFYKDATGGNLFDCFFFSLSARHRRNNFKFENKVEPMYMQAPTKESGPNLS